eukprot:3954400-Prymnesium_polylepis.1
MRSVHRRGGGSRLLWWSAAADRAHHRRHRCRRVLQRVRRGHEVGAWPKRATQTKRPKHATQTTRSKHAAQTCDPNTRPERACKSLRCARRSKMRAAPRHPTVRSVGHRPQRARARALGRPAVPPSRGAAPVTVPVHPASHDVEVPTPFVRVRVRGSCNAFVRFGAACYLKSGYPLTLHANSD